MNHSPSQTSWRPDHCYPWNSSSKTFEMVDTRSDMQLSVLNSKPRGGKSLRGIIDRAIWAHFYLTPGLEHYKLLLIDQFCGPSHNNNNRKMKNEMKFLRI